MLNMASKKKICINNIGCDWVWGDVAYVAVRANELHIWRSSIPLGVKVKVLKTGLGSSKSGYAHLLILGEGALHRVDWFAMCMKGDVSVYGFPLVKQNEPQNRNDFYPVYIRPYREPTWLDSLLTKFWLLSISLIGRRVGQ